MARVLVVEDSPSMRAYIRAALEDEGGLAGEIEVVEAQGGFDALRLLPRGPYDCVISDVNMPDINGLELVNFIRKSQHHRHTPLILVSTQSSERDRARALALGANCYLAKPFEPEQLRALVHTHLRKNSSVDEPAGGVPNSELR